MKTPEMLHRESFSPDPRLVASAKADGDGGGEITGYLAVFGNVDEGMDRIQPGAFSRTIQERVGAGKVPLMVTHFAYGGDTREVIGTIVEAKEDKYGLWIRATLSSTPLAQETRQKIIEGHVKGLSVGYQVIRYEIKTEGDLTITDLLELKLLEGTVTARPMNELATILSAKAHPTLHDLAKTINDLQAEVMELKQKSIAPEAPSKPTASEASAQSMPIHRQISTATLMAKIEYERSQANA